MIEVKRLVNSFLAIAIVSSPYAIANEPTTRTEKNNNTDTRDNDIMSNNILFDTKYSTPFVKVISIKSDSKGNASSITYFEKGVSLQKERKYQSAIDSYKRAIEEIPKLYEASFNMGLCFRYLDKDTEAVDAFRKSLETKPMFKPAVKELFELYEKLGKVEEASTLKSKYSLL